MNNSEYIKKLEDLTYLPSISEVMWKGREELQKILLDKQSDFELEYEIVTEELVQRLIDHLWWYAN